MVLTRINPVAARVVAVGLDTQDTSGRLPRYTAIDTTA